MGGICTSTVPVATGPLGQPIEEYGDDGMLCSSRWLTITIDPCPKELVVPPSGEGTNEQEGPKVSLKEIVNGIRTQVPHFYAQFVTFV